MPKRILTDKQKEQNRLRSARWYRANKEKIRDERSNAFKAYYYANREFILSKARVRDKKRYAHRFFFSRAKAHIARLRSSESNESLCKCISRIWYQQRGICIYTGRRLDRTAQLDHKVPVCKGGDNSPDNLQWITAEANRVKRSMTHSEFIAICTDIAAYIEANKHGK
jgi:hypothetical protein